MEIKWKSRKPNSPSFCPQNSTANAVTINALIYVIGTDTYPPVNILSVTMETFWKSRKRNSPTLGKDSVANAESIIRANPDFGNTRKNAQ